MIKKITRGEKASKKKRSGKKLRKSAANRILYKKSAKIIKGPTRIRRIQTVEEEFEQLEALPGDTTTDDV